ncbi:hypothetical protein N658DRAFT_492821 [Parathielavia hyrcaniae]|uniref:Uncharacterized protein n=1 Tax=Parathielavia hyrcaniae TaxID=113614 RepID=A0AAN6T5E4_9PEZI|nr:hypothetical protein N658DRAFT_492821 [Parathielavia hyrcaniae]
MARPWLGLIGLPAGSSRGPHLGVEAGHGQRTRVTAVYVNIISRRNRVLLRALRNEAPKASKIRYRVWGSGVRRRRIGM